MRPMSPSSVSSSTYTCTNERAFVAFRRRSSEEIPSCPKSTLRKHIQPPESAGVVTRPSEESSVSCANFISSKYSGCNPSDTDFAKRRFTWALNATETAVEAPKASFVISFSSSPSLRVRLSAVLVSHADQMTPPELRFCHACHAFFSIHCRGSSRWKVSA